MNSAIFARRWFLSQPMNSWSAIFGHVVMSRGAGGAVNGLTTRYGEKEFTGRRLESK
jgi:hypothetical protein